MSVPVARSLPRSPAEHVEVAVARAKERGQQITTNRVTRSPWFVGAIGLVLLSPLLFVFAWIAADVFGTGLASR